MADGITVDVSGFFIAPSGNATTKTATFTTDGTDNVIKYTVDYGLVNAAGWWNVFNAAVFGRGTS